MTGLFNNPSVFTNFLSLIFPIVLAGFWAPCNNKWIKRLSLIGVYLMIVTVFLGNERAAFLAFGAGLLLVLNKKYVLAKSLNNFLKTNNVKYYILCLLVVVIAGGSYFLYSIRPQSFFGRLFIYENTLRIIGDHPFLGIGPGKFESIYNLYQSRYFNIHQVSAYGNQVADNTDVAFNDFLQLFCETGLIGFICVVTSAVVLVKIYRNSNFEKNSLHMVGIISGVLSILIASLFSYPLQNFIILLYLVILISLLSKAIAPWKVFRPITLNRNVYAFFGFLWAGTLISILFSLSKNQLKWEANVYDNLEPEASLQQYSELYPVLKNNGYFLYNYGSEMAFNKHYGNGRYILSQAKKYFVDSDILIYSGDCFLGLKDYKHAEEEYLTAYYMVPKKLLPQYALMQYYQEIKDYNKANIFAEKIIKSTPVSYSEDELAIKQQAVQLLTKNCNYYD